MSNAYYEKIDGHSSASLNPPPYSEEAPPLGPSTGTLPTLGYEAIPAMPPEYQPCYGLPREGSSPGAVLYPSRAIFIATALPPSVPDYLGYSIFNMVCCFLPLGIAAFVCSIMTRIANHSGDGTTAQRNSRMALILANTAFGVGLALWIILLTIFLW
ncbi:synapse differentiation-inducing gene protein 1-like [Anolis carolinensis]|uniref:synapse differentiation-inducing gene protein 1-like n=1 Tax=Anolis carolinensis TaxID=28377 RepID=UPI0007DB7925|nr:PREDICTED: synapse differentiation-inducing gene protein 1-like [Anolis carolinensis]|eukprot:XP_016851576.1 PREDICTED: synapse differentiation-inducing gene protein 1-like [Anolis carolinensis]